MRTPKLSLKRMPPEQKARVHRVLTELHTNGGISLSDIALLIGNKTSGYASWVARRVGIQPREFEEARLKAIREKRRKYERRPFDGTDEDKAYMLGLRHGDLSVSRLWRGVVRVSTSTTHPAMAELFRGLFSSYGHVYEHPRYKRDTRTYEWNLSAILDESFGFLDCGVEECWTWVCRSKNRILAYIAGAVDAEGHIGIFRNYRTTAIVISVFNTNRRFLLRLKLGLEKYNYRVLGPYLDKRRGTSSGKYRIVRRKDYWRVAIADFEQCQTLLSSLPMRHQEKLARRQLAVGMHKGRRWEDVKREIEKIRSEILADRDIYVARAAILMRERPSRKSR